MYDMYPAQWRTIDARERKAERRPRPAPRPADREAVQEAMNRRDNGGEPTK